MRRQLTTTLVSPSTDVYADAVADSYLVATLNPATMEALQLFRGDTIIVR